MRRSVWVIFPLMLALTGGIAAGGAAAQAPGHTQLITLGTRGGPIPSNDRAQSSNLLIVDGT